PDTPGRTDKCFGSTGHLPTAGFFQGDAGVRLPNSARKVDTSPTTTIKREGTPHGATPIPHARVFVFYQRDFACCTLPAGSRCSRLHPDPLSNRADSRHGDVRRSAGHQWLVSDSTAAAQRWCRSVCTAGVGTE